MLDLLNIDCIELMKRYPDKYFDLAITDPPYGNNDAIGVLNGNGHSAKRKDYKLFENVAPTEEYFTELKRVSKEQIIWGGNWFGLVGGYLCWNKNGTAFGEAELAYCSMFKSVRVYEYTWNGMLQGNMKDKEQRIHPTQKPVQLYKYLLKEFAKPNFKILDTHLGSGSIAIAVDSVNKIEKMNLTLTASELDEKHYQNALKRIEEMTAQTSLF